MADAFQIIQGEGCRYPWPQSALCRSVPSEEWMSLIPRMYIRKLSGVLCALLLYNFQPVCLVSWADPVQPDSYQPTHRKVCVMHNILSTHHHQWDVPALYPPEAFFPDEDVLLLRLSRKEFQELRLPKKESVYHHRSHNIWKDEVRFGQESHP